MVRMKAALFVEPGRIVLDAVPERLEMANRMGAGHVVNFKTSDPVEEIMKSQMGAVSMWRSNLTFSRR